VHVATARSKRVVVLHYAPVQDTVVGERPEIFCYLGTSVSSK
jgi:hypothetical protein